MWRRQDADDRLRRLLEELDEERRVGRGGSEDVAEAARGLARELEERRLRLHSELVEALSLDPRKAVELGRELRATHASIRRLEAALREHERQRASAPDSG